MNPAERFVFLVHGLWRTRFSLLKLEICLRRAGFTVINRSYPSRKKPLPEHAADLDALVKKTLAGRSAREVHFVTHSMGGMVVRWYLGHHPLELPGRLVMLAPPNQGSRACEIVGGIPLFRMFLGPHASVELGLGEQAAFRTAGIPAREFGIIAGGTPDGRGFTSLLEGNNDGTVRVEETRLEGAKDFLVVHHRHTFIMNGRDTIDATVRFLNEGQF